MSSAMRGALPPPVHRARLFPLPLLAAVTHAPRIPSARLRQRLRLQRTIVAITNRSICTLNRLYSSPSFHASSSSSSQPDNFSSCSCCRPSTASSTAQLRTLAFLRDRCATFVLTNRAWAASHHNPTSDISPSVLEDLVTRSSFLLLSCSRRAAFPSARRRGFRWILELSSVLVSVFASSFYICFLLGAYRRCTSRCVACLTAVTTSYYSHAECATT